MGVLIVSNNPIVKEKLAGAVSVEYYDVDFLGILEVIRDYVHEGAILLTHPLSGSVKPNETPYKSVMLQKKAIDGTDYESVNLIENAIIKAKDFIKTRRNYVEMMSEKVKEDCQIIDYTLILSAMPSAGIHTLSL